MTTRRQFIAGLSGGVGWPLATRAQQPAKVPRIGFLVTAPFDTPEFRQVAMRCAVLIIASL